MAAEFLLLSGASVTPDHGPVQEVADADRERNYAERGHRPDVAIRLNARNQSESSDVAECAADQQDAGTAGTPPPVQFMIQPNVNSPGHCREPCFATDFADPAIGVHRA